MTASRGRGVGLIGVDREMDMNLDGIGHEDLPDGATRAYVHLFGGPYVTHDGDRLAVPEGSKRLLAFVALRGCAVERRHVAGTLWPCGDDGRAAGNLRSALWRLRGAGIEVLECDKWSLRLAGDVAVDVHAVHAWADRLIADRLRPGDLTLSPVRLDALDLLPGWYDDWTTLERERLRQRVLHALEALSRELSHAGRHADAVEVAISAINAEPLRESAQRCLIAAHVGEGNWVEARHAFVAYRDLLRRELGVSPSRQLAAFVYDSAPMDDEDLPMLQTAVGG
jgi:DNA-binding SARP family transcriptional activator